MVSQKVTIKNPTGLHLRPAGILCKEAMKFKSLITFKFSRPNPLCVKSLLILLLGNFNLGQNGFNHIGGEGLACIFRKTLCRRTKDFRSFHNIYSFDYLC